MNIPLRIILLFIFTRDIFCDNATFSMQFIPTSMSLEVEDDSELKVVFSRSATHSATFAFTYRDLNGKYLDPSATNDSTAIGLLSPFNVTNGTIDPIVRHIIALRPGHVYVGLNETSGNYTIPDLPRVVCQVSVMHQRWLNILESVIGWMYFSAWTISFYPQVILNWQRKSVVGFNLDFLFLNLVGFFIYSVFNVSLYAIPSIKDLYHRLYPIGEIPVRLNDIFFSVHAFLICIVTGIQVVIYERGEQRVSRVCIAVLSLIAIYSLLNAILAGSGVFNWLTFLYNFSYCKLFITLVKYIPQAVMNCRRRSTVGWSIGNICLDMTGGLLSILQMFIIAYNYDDWGSVFGSPTKMGLGLFSIVFDVFFMVQHWCLYPHTEELTQSVEPLNGSQSSLYLNRNDPDDRWDRTTGVIYRRASDEANLTKHMEAARPGPGSF